MTLPSGWVNVKLGDVADSSLGKMLDRAKHTEGDNLPYLRNQNVRWKSFDLSDLYTMFFKETELERYGVVPGDVLICEGGEPGRCAIWKGPAGEMQFQKALHRVRPSEALEAEYLVNRLMFDANTGSLAKYFTGTTIKHLPGNSLRTYELPLPPLPEQRRIVARLDELLARGRKAKASLSRLPALLDRLRQSVLAAAFRGDLTKAWRDAHRDVEPADKLLERIRVERRRKWEEAQRAKGKDPKKLAYKEPAPVEAEGLPELPAGWAWASLGELTQIDGGVTKGQRRQPGTELVEVPYLRVANVQRGYLDLQEILTIEATPDDIAKLRLLRGDILFNEGGDRDKLGRGWVWGGELDCCIHQNHVFRARPYSGEIVPELVSLYSNSVGAKYFVDEGKQTTNLASINKTKLSCFPVPVAPPQEQLELSRLLNERLGSIERVSSGTTLFHHRLATLEQSLLAKAFRGELVPQDPSDEPASVLLERIRAERAASGAVAKRGRKAKAPALAAKKGG